MGMKPTAACFAAASDARGSFPSTVGVDPPEQQHRRHPSWRGKDGHVSRLWKNAAKANMSALSAMLPSWSTVLLVLLIGILALSYWVVRGVSVETLLASYRLVNQGKEIRIQDVM